MKRYGAYIDSRCDTSQIQRMSQADLDRVLTQRKHDLDFVLSELSNNIGDLYERIEALENKKPSPREK